MYFDQIGFRNGKEIMGECEKALKKHYPSASKFIGTPLHNLFNSAIADIDFLKILIFNNDKLNIPPVEVFSKQFSVRLSKLRVSKEGKQALGAMFGALFRFTLYDYDKVDNGRKQYKDGFVSSASYFIYSPQDEEFDENGLLIADLDDDGFYKV